MHKSVVANFITRVDDAVNNQDSDPYELLDENVQILVNGTTPLSGLYKGFNILNNVLLSTVRRRIASISVKLFDCIGDEERVAALLMITAQTVDGKTYNENSDPAGCIFTVRDGKISSIHFFPDTYLIETVIFNKALVSK